ncbi:MAG TPA: long-chain fatty acid--CoA ligase [Terriglobales bacterium]
MPIRAQWKSRESPGLTSLNQLLGWCADGGEAPRLARKQAGVWQTLSCARFFAQACALSRRIEASPGERVAILAESSPEWLIADFACLAAGVIDVPIYPTLTAPQVAHILRDSGAIGAFVSTAEQKAKIISQRAELPALRWICCFADSDWTERLAPAGAPPTLAELEATPASQLATLLYTSGTTGTPKGVMLTHANLCANLNVSTMDFYFGEGERRLSILPLSHITERHIAYVDMLYDATTYFAESMEAVAANLIEVRPTVLVSVPRLYEKIAAGVRAQAAAKPALARRIFAWSQLVGRELAPHRLAGTRPPRRLRWRAHIAHRLVWRKLRDRMGGALTKCISGGAPLGRDVAEFMLAMSVVVDEGYGLSETSPVIALNRPGKRRLGSVGQPLPNVEVRVAEDGELQVRGPSVFSGYWNLPQESAAALRDGWFQTGDIGHQDKDGFLYITDRKKDLIKTSGGKFIAPQPIEALLKRSALIAEAVVIGDGRNYAVALLVPQWPEVARRGLTCDDRAAACANAAVRALFQQALDEVNATLARFETIKKFALLAQEFTVESGELTPTVKVRRRAVEARHSALIASLYD